MDQLQQLKEFRASEPPASDTAHSAARAALGDAISAERPQRLRRRPRIRTMAFAGVAAAVASAVLVGVFGLSGSPNSGSPRTGPPQVLVSSTMAVKALRHLANSIVVHPLTVHPGQYLYSDSRSDYPTFSGGCVTDEVDHRQMWVGADGSGLVRDTEEAEQFTSLADKARCLQDDPNMQLRPAHTDNDWYAPNCQWIVPVEIKNWSDLSSDPHVLLRQFRQLREGPPTPGMDFIHIGNFLRMTNTPPRVRSALYRAAALIPGIRLLGTVQDHDGRTGLGISFPSQSPFTSGPHAPPAGQTSELIFDQHSGELLGEQGTRPRFWAVYQPEKVVDTLPTPPAQLDSYPPCKTVGAGHTLHQYPNGTVTGG
jgi:hypothetical protein